MPNATKFYFPPMPEFTEHFPAIDGIGTKPGKPYLKECNTSGSVYETFDPGTEPIRPDIRKFLESRSDDVFRCLNLWQSTVERRLDSLRLIAEIPDLRIDVSLESYPVENNFGTIGSYTIIRSEIELLEKAMEFIHALRARINSRKEIKQES